MQETQGRAEVREKSQEVQTNMLAVHETAATRIFSHKYSFSPLLGCALLSRSVPSSGWKSALAQLRGAPLQQGLQGPPSTLGSLHWELRAKHSRNLGG